MRAIPRACVAVALAAPLTACAAKTQPVAEFAPSRWGVVEALRPGTRVDVAYVTGQRRYSFTGAIESVDATFLVLRTDQGQQRLLAERVRRVSRMTPGGNRMGRGALFGAAAGALFGAWFAGEDYKRPDSMRVCAGVGALVGASFGARFKGETRQVLYERR